MSVLARVSREARRRFANRRAVVQGDVALTYAQLDEAADEVASGFADVGVRLGSVVALVLPTGIDYVVTYVALSRLGAVVAGVGPRYAAAERAQQLAVITPDLVVATPELAEGAGGAVQFGLPRGSAALPELDDDLDRPETIVMTSGTTGVPKGALFTSRQIAAITAIDTGGEWGGGGSQLVATGLPHVGFMTKLAGHVQAGATLHLLERWRAADSLRVIARERIAYVGGVAAQISLLLRVPDFDAYDLSAVQGLIVGAGPSPPKLVREARRQFDAGYSIRYSSTESGGLGTLTAFDAPDSEALHTVGRPRPGTELEIRELDSGEPVAVGEVGQICLRSPAVMAGYWRDDAATRSVLDPHGWLSTGDLGYVGADGCLRVTGRIAEMYIRGGYNVFPLEVEAVLGEHPAIGAVVVVPRPDAVMGELGVAVVVPRPGHAAPTLEQLRAFAADRLAPHKLPEALRIADALPLTSMDKIDRRALAAAEHPTDPAT